MADSKISALPASTTPLAGTEVLPIVQSSATKQVSVANLTAGRSVSVADLVVSTNNIVPSTAAKGINFTANTPKAGMTSQLLNWYEEGTWTGGTITGSNCSAISLVNATYTRVGRLVSIQGSFGATLTTTATAVYIYFTLPFATLANFSPATGSVDHSLSSSIGTGIVADSTGGESTSAYLGIATSQVTKVNGSTFTANFSFTYASA